MFYFGPFIQTQIYTGNIAFFRADTGLPCKATLFKGDGKFQDGTSIFSEPPASIKTFVIKARDPIHAAHIILTQITAITDPLDNRPINGLGSLEFFKATPQQIAAMQEAK
jgi:hypothetical protein